MSIRKTILITICILLFGCENKVEIIFSTHDNGQVQEVLILDKPVTKDSIGIKKIFYSNGDVECCGGYKNGQRNGEWICYYPNGEIEWKSVIKDGKENGETFCNYQNGTWRKINSINGIMEGKTIEYNLDTTNNQYFYIYGQYKNGEEDGLWIKKDTNNILLIEVTFKEGKPIGYFANYYPDGKLKIKGELKEDGKMINFEFYDENGKKVKRETYRVNLI